MSTAYELFRSSTGYTSPYFIVDSDGNLITQTLTIAGKRLELTQGSSISSGGDLVLSPTTLGAGIVNVLGTLTALSVNGAVSLGTASSLTVSPTGLGTVTMNPTTAGTINNISVGATVAASGRFSSLSVTGSATISPIGTVAISPTGTVAISPTGTTSLGTAGQNTSLLGQLQAVTVNQTVTLSPSGTGTVVISPTTTGSINNMDVGAAVASSGRFTQATVTTPDQNWNSEPQQLATKRYVENSVMFAYFTGR